MEGIATVLVILFFLLLYRKAEVRRRVGPGEEWRTPKRIRRSTSYAARQGRDYAHGGNRGHWPKNTNWDDDSWGW